MPNNIKIEKVNMEYLQLFQRRQSKEGAISEFLDLVVV